MKLDSLFLLSLANLAICAPVGSIGQIKNKPAPTILLGHTKLTGSYHISAEGFDIESYRGIPYAQPPTNGLRFKPPVRYNTNHTEFDASGFGKACMALNKGNGGGSFTLGSEGLASYGVSMPMEFARGYQAIGRNYPESEDCLFVNVFKPSKVNDFMINLYSDNSTAQYDEKLPVIVWFHGGGFTSGSSNAFRGESIVGESMRLNMPVIYVSFNYRLGPWGFLGGKELEKAKATNVGFLDQRIVLEWVADNIKHFGGDPDNVTIMGESAGAMSVASHLVYKDGDHRYKGKPLFARAIMQSGGLMPYNNLTTGTAQSAFDSIVQSTGCDKSVNKVHCLRRVSSEELKKAAQAVDPTVLSLAFTPRVDGTVFKEDLFKSWKEGKFAKVPYISGNQEDEATVLALTTSPSGSVGIQNGLGFLLLTNNAMVDPQFMEQVLRAYPPDPEQGSPYRTERLNMKTPEYKRMASIMGDAIFQAPRRFMIDNTPEDVVVYTYLGSTGYGTPYIGTSHASDVVWQYELDFGPSKVYNGYFLSFANNGDVNNNNTGLPYWPIRTSQNKTMMNVHLSEIKFIQDTYREDGMNKLINGNFI